MQEHSNSLDTLSINTLRFLAIDAVERAGVGHAGTPLGAAPAAYILWDRFLKHDPSTPDWADRDRFVLSCGHASLLLYGLLHLSGYQLSIGDITRFREWGSITPGHPEYRLTQGVEMTTGPLGQGFSFAVGMAMAETHLAARFNRDGLKIIDHHIYVLASDGDLQEGVSSEAASLAGTLGLSKLVVLYDDNNMQIEGHTDLTFREDVAKRFSAYGWRILSPVNGEDLPAIEAAVQEAINEQALPTLITIQSRIGFGTPVEDSPKAHHGPIGKGGREAACRQLGWASNEPFFVPDQVRETFARSTERGSQAHREWLTKMGIYKQRHLSDYEELTRSLNGMPEEGWDRILNGIKDSFADPIAPRAASGSVINQIATEIPSLLGGSADLSPSTKTWIDTESAFEQGHYSGRNIHYGVREHAMAATAGGMVLHGGVRPFISTYLIFSDYMRPAIRLTAMMELPVIYVFTHDSIAVGKDGSTHQSVEQIMGLRTIPGLIVIRPADAIEVVEAWRVAVNRLKGPTALLLARQTLPIIDRSKYGSASGVQYGAYLLWETSEECPAIILIGTGSETHLALEAGLRLADDGVKVRVLSMPSWELFDAQPQSYQQKLLPREVSARISVEAGVTLGWGDHLGRDGYAFGVDAYGSSAPADKLYEHFGLTADKICEKAKDLLSLT
jgi:transketolase